jgi:uncharacterized protein (DUF488 family)
MSQMTPIATIGYEKATLDDVIGRLKAAEIGLLIDVRAVAASRRAGFSKTLLSATLREAGVDYLHLRDLGTPKSGRQAARAGRIGEMTAIFDAHMQTASAQGALVQAMEAARKGRVCLLCYEADAACCHRKIVADQMNDRLGATIIHL